MIKLEKVFEINNMLNKHRTNSKVFVVKGKVLPQIYIPQIFDYNLVTFITESSFNLSNMNNVKKYLLFIDNCTTLATK